MKKIITYLAFGVIAINVVFFAVDLVYLRKIEKKIEKLKLTEIKINVDDKSKTTVYAKKQSGNIKIDEPRTYTIKIDTIKKRVTK